MSGLEKGLTEDQLLRRVVEKVCEQVWSQDKTAIKEALAQPEQEPVAYNLEMQRLRDEFPFGIPFVTQDELERLRKETE